MLMAQAKQQGNSLAELTISMGLGLASITAMASLVGHGIGLNASLLAKSRLDEEVNAVLAVISEDVKRAGFHALTENMLNDPVGFINPFTNKTQISQYPKEAADSCITFAYDRNKNGQLDTKNSNENYGYRLKNKAIEVRLDGFNCEQNGWHDLTDPKVIKVTQLTFVLEKHQALQLSQSKLAISMHAYLVKHPDISRHVQTTVNLANL